MSLSVSLERLTAESPLPLSFNGSPLLYAAALASVMAIACLGLAIAGWMARDTWRDRWTVHPRSLLFCFRAMMGIAGFAAFFRAMPEVLFLQVYGDPDVSPEVQAAILTAKRIADTTALWFVLTWMFILVPIYPHVCMALRQGIPRGVVVDSLGTWPRLARPFLTFVIILIAAMAFAYGKVYAR